MEPREVKPDIDRLEELRALKDIDWGQVIANGGPPCFHIETGKLCLRAERWPGHHVPTFHKYVSLEQRETAMIEELRRLREVETAARNLERSIATGGVCYVNETLEYDALRTALEKGKE